MAALQPGMGPHMTDRPGLLELLHPDGHATTAVMVQVRCPASWLPSRGDPAGSPVDLAVLGSEVDEAHVRQAAARLSPDGVLCMFAPRSGRRKVRKWLHQSGVEVVHSLLIRRVTAGWERLISLDPGAIRRASGRWLPAGAHHLLGWWYPEVVLIGRRPEARPCCQWMTPGGMVEAPTLLLQEKRRGARSSIVIELLDRRSQLVRVAKVALSNGVASESVVREAEAMTCLASAVSSSGADLPAASVVLLPGGCPAILQSPLEGRQVDGLLARGKLGVDVFVSRLTDWLERWNRLTMTIRTIDREWLEREVLAPAEVVVHRLAGGAGYLERLRVRCAGVEGDAVPLVATHCDLTTSNILDGKGGRLGVVDWESSQEAGLPLRDVIYGIVDAVWAASGRGSRIQAFQDCFEGGGKHLDLARGSEIRIRRALGLSDEFAALCFHGCWLQHAADEAAARGATDPEPFLGIVERLADQRHE